MIQRAPEARQKVARGQALGAHPGYVNNTTALKGRKERRRIEYPEMLKL